ncbi:MAG: ribonuclease R [Ruminococcaceae bacterium]|nr:ribonuclease R [Oscillospiraceae bacterium]
MNRKDKILSFINDKEYKPMNIKEIMTILDVPKSDKWLLDDILSSLEQEGKIFKNSKNKYISSDSGGFVKAIFYAKGKGYGFAIDENDEKYFVPPSKTKGAFDRDNVLIKVTKQNGSGDKCSECEIIRILSHGCNSVVGTFVKERNFGFVVPDSKSFGCDVFVSKKHCADAKDGQKVVVKITKWPERDENPEGVIEEVLGFSSEEQVDIKSIIRQYGISEIFPQKVELSALSFGDRVYEEELSGREDFRDRLIFTIDGEDAKDFDDAVEIEKNEKGYRLGVHIADVSYYVSENSALDIEARKRGTSVYLPGCVVPMLPERLSNGLCSLNPHCDRLCLSVIMNFDNSGKLVSHSIYESVINSKFRMTYTDVAAIIDGDKEKTKEFAPLANTIHIMNELREKLKAARCAKGSIDFDFPEVKVVLDDTGKAVDVFKYYSNKAHSLIEEFMLAANVCVAEEMFWCELPFIYRIHEKPSPEKMSTFSKFLSQLGVVMKANRDNPTPGAFASVLKKIKGTNKELMISKVMLRSLMKAKYSEINLGHFGLGFDHYCHFTSPIRRYPDLAIHRIIKEHLKYGLTDNRKRFLTSFVKKAAKTSSMAEINAMEAERDASDMKKAEYMMLHIGEIFEATITSTTSFGIFAETDFGIEGLISMTDLSDDYYEFDESNFCLKGKKHGKEYSIGDRLTIKVKRADSQAREIDYTIESGDENE